MEILKRFVVFEGIDGAGTTTQARLLCSKIKKGFFTCEPGDHEIGRLIRAVLKKEIRLDPVTLTYLFSADRSHHLYGENGVLTHVEKDEITVSDRYFFSTFAYQGLSVDEDIIRDLNSRFPLPEIVFFINTRPDLAQKRLLKRGEEAEIFDALPLQEKIYSNYQRVFKLYKNTAMSIYELDGTLPIETLLERELEILKSHDYPLISI